MSEIAELAPILFRAISDISDVEQLTNKRRYIAMACDFWSENGDWRKDNKYSKKIAGIQHSVFSEALKLADQKLVKLRKKHSL